ncbi:hypothetical protein FHX52_3869 [Humibacillus xanthopallidus]|uniref:Uncharacterized protein n=1 Tax=Humibacillus xanthopallidus TaxID=412689 RepID=A0A543PKQ0_9MICO|nr:hypothetical protein [Humibacillus xanthopallidus]TQN44652.1 hypothetical protein FHX52_3869 [Humibacillus xanthopallidus]
MPNQTPEQLDMAIRVQGYRPIDVSVLEQAEAVRIGEGLPADMAHIFRGVVDQPNWQFISQQLALMRTRSPHFCGLYMAVRENLFCLAVVHEYPRPAVTSRFPWADIAYRDNFPVGLDAWRRDYDWVWDVLRFLEPAVGSYRISKELGQAVREATNRYSAEGSPAISAGLSLLASALDLAEASRGPCGTFIGIARNGVDWNLEQALRKSKFSATKGVFSTIPGLSAFAWDPRSGVLYGNGMPDALERGSLERSLRA